MPLLDDFNRANEGPPPGASWATIVLFSGDADGWKVVGNQCVQNGAGAIACTAAFSGTIGPTMDVSVTLAVPPTAVSGRPFDLHARITTPGVGTTDGYRFRLLPNNTPVTEHLTQLGRIDNGVVTQLGLNLSTDLWQANDKMVFRLVGDQITGARVRAGVETVLGTRTDATYATAGQVMIRGNAADTVIDDFGGAFGFSNTSVPTLTGTPSVGNVLTVAPGVWDPATVVFGYYWHQSDDAAGTNLVSVGSTGSTYTVAAANDAKYIHAGVIPGGT